MALGDPTQGEERRPYLGGVEAVEQPLGVALDAAFQGIPVLAADGPLERRDLEMLLDVDGEGVEGWGRGAQMRFLSSQARSSERLKRSADVLPSPTR
jgi:hypothetical protein